jgi:hypothetical protein
MQVNRVNIPGFTGKRHVNNFFSSLVSTDAAGDEASFLLLLHNSRP